MEELPMPNQAESATSSDSSGTWGKTRSRLKYFPLLGRYLPRALINSSVPTGSRMCSQISIQPAKQISSDQCRHPKSQALAPEKSEDSDLCKCLPLNMPSVLEGCIQLVRLKGQCLESDYRSEKPGCCAKAREILRVNPPCKIILQVQASFSMVPASNAANV